MLFRTVEILGPGREAVQSIRVDHARLRPSLDHAANKSSCAFVIRSQSWSNCDAQSLRADSFRKCSTASSLTAPRSVSARAVVITSGIALAATDACAEAGVAIVTSPAPDRIAAFPRERRRAGITTRTGGDQNVAMRVLVRLASVASAHQPLPRVLCLSHKQPRLRGLDQR